MALILDNMSASQKKVTIVKHVDCGRASCLVLSVHTSSFGRRVLLLACEPNAEHTIKHKSHLKLKSLLNFSRITFFYDTFPRLICDNYIFFMMASKALFEIPPGATAQVYIIDSTFRMSDMPASFLLTPDVDRLEKLPPIASWSFLLEGPKGQKVLFDLGGPPDIRSLSPVILNQVIDVGVRVEVTKHVAGIIKDHGVDPSEVGSVIWRFEPCIIFLIASCKLTTVASHHHWDHVGDIRAFPGTTELVVGPGFKAAYLPGYPTQQDSPLEESYFE